jgi:hypothetical protein
MSSARARKMSHGWVVAAVVSLSAGPLEASGRRNVATFEPDYATAPSYRYANTSPEGCLAELARRGIAYRAVPEARGVRAPVRLLAGLRGVTFRTELSRERAAESPWEVFDCRLVLALHDFAEVLGAHDIDEVLIYSAWRPPPKSWPTDKQARRHPGALAVDVYRFRQRASPRLLAAAAEAPAPSPAPSAAPAQVPASEAPATPSEPCECKCAAPAEAPPANSDETAEKAPYDPLEEVIEPPSEAPPSEPPSEEPPSEAPPSEEPRTPVPSERPEPPTPVPPAENAPAQAATGHRWLDVQQHFHGAIGAPICGPSAPTPSQPSGEAITLRSIVCQTAARRIFSSMLTPNYDQAHFNHLHLEVTPEAKWRIVR